MVSFKLVSHNDIISYWKKVLCASSWDTLWKSFLLRVLTFQLQKEKKLLLNPLAGASVPLDLGPGLVSISDERNINSPKIHNDNIWKRGLSSEKKHFENVKKVR